MNKNLGMILLAVFLILAGLSGLGNFGFGASIYILSVVEAVCALAAGVLVLLNR